MLTARAGAGTRGAGDSVRVSTSRARPILASILFASAMSLSPAQADKIKNPIAVFNGLDKITGRIIAFEVGVDETVQFGALQLTPRVCFSRPPTETPNTTSFIEVDEVTFQNSYRRIFTGWVFASSPGLNAIEHPIYDLWLTECKGGTEIIREEKEPEIIPEAQPRPERPQRPVAPPQDRANRPQTPSGQIAPQAPVGQPTQPRQPTQRFFPTNPSDGIFERPDSNR